MAITSTTGAVDGSEITFDISTKKGSARGAGIIAYVDYTKAGTDDVFFGFSFLNTETDAVNYFDQILVSGTTLSLFSINMTATGKYRIPISISSNEDTVKISVTGLDTGSINVEFSIDNGYL